MWIPPIGPFDAGDIYANYSFWEKLWRGVDIGADKGLTVVVGFADTITFGGSKWASKKFATVLGGQGAAKEWERDNAERERSWYHTAGSGLGYVWDFATGEELAVANSRSLGWGGRLSIDWAHHTFGRFGKLSHLQLDLWKVGVKASNKTLFHIPLFLRRIPKRNIVLRRW
jgi:hypothetical protein